MAKTPEEALVAAKAAYKADKKNKDLKKAYKAAQTAAAAWKAEQAAAEAKAAKKAAKKAKKDKKRKAEEPVAVAEVEAPAKKAKKAKKDKKDKKETPKVDLASLKAAAKAAKTAHKANPSDAALKQAYKAAKSAVKNFKAATPVQTPAETPAETPADAETPAETPAVDDSDELSSLKNKSTSDAPMPANANEKLFLGNVSWDMDDESIKEFFKDCGTLVDIFWLTDKETGNFKGCGFVTFETKEQAVQGQALSGEYVMGREIKIEFASPRPGGDRGSFKKGGGGGGGAAKPLSERPDNCTTVFAGNLSWDVDDDSMREFAKDAGEVKSIRWVTDRNTGDFKGCGFIEFWDSDAVDKFVKKNGEQLMNRNIRLDYAAPRDS